MVDRLDIGVEAEGSKPVNVTIEIDLQLSPKTPDVDADVLVMEATSAAHKAVESFLRKIK